jgi:N-formylglutamate amidohydrolase
MPLPPPIVIPAKGDLPVLLSVPHAGRDYPDWLLALAAGGRDSLSSLEDPLVDELAWRAIRRGAGAVIARAPRAAVDCNRAEDEIDPMVIESPPIPKLSPRARGGLGIIPGRTAAHGPLWRRSIEAAQLEERLDQAHRPYHELLSLELERLVERFGCALLLDCHSMPPLPRGGPTIIIGDRHGRTADHWLTCEAVRVIASAGYRPGVNEPFAGGHVIERHGARERGIQALQIEIDRRCYLRDGLHEPGPGFDRCARLVESLALQLGQALLDRRYPAAAE